MTTQQTEAPQPAPSAQAADSVQEDAARAAQKEGE